MRNELSLAELKTLVADLKQTGLKESEVLQIVEGVYQEESHD